MSNLYQSNYGVMKMDYLERIGLMAKTEREEELERRCEILAAEASKYRALLERERQDAERWRWLRQCEGWPDSEAAISGFTPEEFDAMANRFMGKRPNVRVQGADAALCGSSPATTG
jgi:hypothetical protein